MARREYIVELKADDKNVKKVVSDANGEIQKLNDNQIIVSVDLEKASVGQVRDLLQYLANADPTLNVQLTYDMNVKALEEARDRAKKLLDLNDLYQNAGNDKAQFEQYVSSEADAIREAIENGESGISQKGRFKRLIDMIASYEDDYNDYLSKELSEKVEAVGDLRPSVLGKLSGKSNFAQQLTNGLVEANNQITILDDNLKLLESKGAVAASDGPIKGTGEYIRSFERLLNLQKSMSDIEVPTIDSKATDSEKAERLKELAKEFKAVNDEVERLKDTASKNGMTSQLEDQIGLLSKYQLEIQKAYDEVAKGTGNEWAKKNLGEESFSWLINDFDIDALEDYVDAFQKKIGHAYTDLMKKDRKGFFGLINDVFLGLGGAQNLYDTELQDSFSRIDAAVKGVAASTEKKADAEKSGAQSTEQSTNANNENGASAEKESDANNTAAGSAERKASAEKSNADSTEQSSSANSSVAESAEREAAANENAAQSAEKKAQAEKEAADATSNRNKAESESSKGDNSSLTEMKTILESINTSLQNVSTSLGTVDDEAGFTNLIGSLKQVRDLMEEIGKKDFNLIFNEADKSADLGTYLDKEINNVYERYSKAYEDIMNLGKKYGMDSEGVLASIYGSDDRRTGYSSLSDFIDRFSKASLKDLDPKTYISTVQELIKYVKSARQEMSEGIYDDLMSMKLPTDDTSEIKRRFDNAIKEHQKANANTIVENALNKAKPSVGSSEDTSVASDSAAALEREASAMDHITFSGEMAASAKRAVVDANRELGGLAGSAASALEREASAMETIAKVGEEAASAKKKVAEANKDLGDTAKEATDDERKLNKETSKAQSDQGVDHRTTNVRNQNAFERQYNKLRERILASVTDELSQGVAMRHSNLFQRAMDFSAEDIVRKGGVTLTRDLEGGGTQNFWVDLKDEEDWSAYLATTAAETDQLYEEIDEAREKHNQRQKQHQQEEEDILRREKEAQDRRKNILEQRKKTREKEANAQRKAEEKEAAAYANEIEKARDKNIKAQQEVRSFINEKEDSTLRNQYIKRNFPELYDRMNSTDVYGSDFSDKISEQFKKAKQEVLDFESSMDKVKNGIMDFASKSGLEIMPGKYQKYLQEYNSLLSDPTAGNIETLLFRLQEDNAKLEQVLKEREESLKQYNDAQQKYSEAEKTGVFDVYKSMFPETSAQDMLDLKTTFNRMGEYDTASIKAATEALDAMINKISEAKSKMQEEQESSQSFAETFSRAVDMRDAISKFEGELKSAGIEKAFSDDIAKLKADLSSTEISTESLDIFGQRLDELKQKASDLKKESSGEFGSFLSEVKSLMSGRGRYIKDLQAYSQGNKDPITEQAISDYSGRISAMYAELDTLSAKWGENSSQVQKASEAVREYESALAKTIGEQAKIKSDKIQSIIDKGEVDGRTISPDVLEELKRIKSSMDEIQKSARSLIVNPDRSGLEKLREEFKESSKSVDELSGKIQKFATKTSVNNLFGKITKDIASGNLKGNLKNQFQELSDAVESVVKASSNIDGKFTNMNLDQMNEYVAKWKELRAEMIRTGQDSKGFSSKFAEAINNQSAQFLATYFSFQDMIRYGKQITQTVIDTDSAITELRKVSGESNERLQQSFQTSAETAQELGTSITSVIQSTSDWARLNKTRPFTQRCVSNNPLKSVELQRWTIPRVMPYGVP